MHTDASMYLYMCIYMSYIVVRMYMYVEVDILIILFTANQTSDFLLETAQGRHLSRAKDSQAQGLSK